MALHGRWASFRLSTRSKWTIRPLPQNVRNFVADSRAHNVISADVGVDVQSDRRIPRSERPGRLHVVERRPDGLVLSGAKACASISAIAHFSTCATSYTPD